MASTDLNSGASKSRVGGARTTNSAGDLKLKGSLVDPSAQELAGSVSQQIDILLNQMEGNANLQEAIRAVTGEVKGMMADGNEEAMEEVMEAVEAIMANPIYQEYTRRLIDQLEAMKAHQNFPGLATPVAQLMKTLMT